MRKSSNKWLKTAYAFILCSKDSVFFFMGELQLFRKSPLASKFHLSIVVFLTMKLSHEMLVLSRFVLPAKSICHKKAFKRMCSWY